jgi:hypothetical protein
MCIYRTYLIVISLLVLYFDASEQNDTAYLVYEVRLTKEMPNLNWQVRNQAKMHGEIVHRNSKSVNGSHRQHRQNHFAKKFIKIS